MEQLFSIYFLQKVAFFRHIQLSSRKVREERVQTRGYQALRILHADTPTRLSNESAREAQTFLDDLWNP